MTTVRATILQTPQPGRLEILEDHVVTVAGDGQITSVAAASSDTTADIHLSDRHVLLPGMIDTHIHAPQWPQLGTGLDLPLERWLFEYTFPLEARFSDLAYAGTVWNQMVPSLLSHGTTTAVYYGSVHEAATTALAEACLRHGQRALVGRVAMDHPTGTPEWYRDSSAEEAIAASGRSIEAIRATAGGSDLVQPIITPRFIPACTDAALRGLGELAEQTGVRVQTHCSESDWEHGYVLERHGRTDAHALDQFGLLPEHSVLAHATHLANDDRALLAQRGAGVAHCPLSNVYFANQPFSTRLALDAGVRVGLGTDVAGGPSPSLIAQCGHAVAASQRLADAGDPAARIDTATAFWMATLGGAEMLGIEAGLIASGKQFDAIAVDCHRPAGIGVNVDHDDYERIFEKVVRLTTPADITQVWVDGRDVTPTHVSAGY